MKQAFQRARLAKTKETWKQALEKRRKARRAWEQTRLALAASGDWGSFRDCKPGGPVGWEVDYAESQTKDAHQTIHEHLAKVYDGPEVRKYRDTGPTVRAFTLEELQLAISGLKSSKSVGVDLTSAELFRGIIRVEGGPIHLLEYFNRILTTRCVPPSWNRPLVILLPKVPSPTSPSQLRPIALGSSAAKVFSKMLLQRLRDRLGFRTHAQCAGQGRQTADLLFSVHRLLELAREWKLPIAFLKIDISKAFDSLSRQALLDKLYHRLGASAEFFALQALLTDVRATLQSPWGCTQVPMLSGIKQGAAESPMLFSFIMELALSEAEAEFGWGNMQGILPELRNSDLLYMDDGILWARGCLDLATKIRGFATVLSRYGLSLNLKKCQLYCTPACPQPHVLALGESKLMGQTGLEIMGLSFYQGVSMTALMHPMMSRAQNKFWSLKHIFRSKVSSTERLRLMHKVVTNSGLWCCSAFPPDKGALKMVNTQQTLLIGWLLRLGKRKDEGWLPFRLRLVRSARAMLHKAGLPRWSTCWLQRWWGYSGHRVRCALRDFPPFSTELDFVRTLPWWKQQSAAGRQHPGQFFPRLMNLERAMDKACSGAWRECAHDRKGWNAKMQTWIDQQDLPWASGLQLSLTAD